MRIYHAIAVFWGWNMRIRRRIDVLVVVVVLLAGVAAAPTPAAAHVDACAGVGTMDTPALLWPGLAVVPPAGPLLLTLPLCALPIAPMAAVGTIGGWCGYAWGSGFAAGHFFVFTIAGSTMVVTGAATGVLQVQPNVTAGESCTIGGADSWLVEGALALAP